MASCRPRTVLLATLISACSDENTSKPPEPNTTGWSGGSITLTTPTTTIDSTSTTDSTATDSTGTTGAWAPDTTTGDAVCIAPTDSDTAGDATSWTRSHGVPSESITADATHIAPDGSITATLSFGGQIDLGDGPVDTKYGSYYFLARYSAAGEFAWSAHIGTAEVDIDTRSSIENRVMAVDCAGNVVVGGSFFGTIVVQGKPLTAVPGTEQEADVTFTTEDIFLVKFGPDGVRRWARRFGDDRQQRIHDLEIQADGTIVVVGASNGTLDLGGAPIVSDEYVGLLAAFDPGGQLVWQRTYSSNYADALEGLSIGADDRLSVYGHAAGDTDFGGGPVVYTGDPTFIAQFEPDGAHRWSARFFDIKYNPYRVGTDAAGGAVFNGAVGDNQFIARYDNTGQLAWNHDLIPAENTNNVRISAFMVDDEVVIGGTLSGTFDFGGGPLVTPQDQSQPFLTRYDLAGAHVASATYDATQARFSGADRGPDGELALLGVFVGMLDLGDGPLKALGEQDVFLHRFHP